jgi:O-antigen/teichoic acid export membrane protein
MATQSGVGEPRLRLLLPRMDASMRRDFKWVLSGNVIYAACQWATLAVLAKLAQPEVVGEYALGVAVTAPILMFANLQLRALVSADVEDTYSFGQYLGFRLATLGASLVAVASIVAFAGYSLELSGAVILIGISQGLEFVSETYYGLLQKHDRMDRVSRALIVKGPLALTALGFGMYFTNNLPLAVVAQMTVRVMVLLGYETRLNLRGARGSAKSPSNRPEWRLTFMRQLLRKSLPLGIIATLITLNLNIPRYFLEGSWGKRELGIFSAIASLVGAGNLIMAALGQSAYVRLVRAWATHDFRTFRSLLAILLGTACVLGGAAIAGSALWGRSILARLFRPEYAQSADSFLILMVAAAFAFAAYGQGVALTAIGSFHPQIVMLLCATIAACVASSLLVPSGGLRGASEALAFASLAQVTAGAVILARTMTRSVAAIEETACS